MSALVAGSRTLPVPARHGVDAILGDGPAVLARHRTFHTLDALRGVAAVAVVLFHAAFFYGLTAPAEGQIAVDLFFVMSGFVIAYRYDADFRAGLTLRAFLEVRLIRLYPLVLLGAILGAIPAVVAVAFGDPNPVYRGLLQSVPPAVLLLPSRFALPHLGEVYPLNYVTWSLALEILVNIAYAATFRFWTIRRLTILLAAAFAGLVACLAVFGTLNVGFEWAHAAGGVARILYGFPMGVLIFRLYSVRPFAIRVPWWSLIGVALAVFFFHAPAMVKPLWELVAVAVIVPCIVVAAVANEPPRIARGLCALAGVFSYVVYSLQAPFIGLFLRGQERLHFHPPVAGTAFVFTVLFLALCTVAHLGYDKPIRRFLTRRRQARRGGSRGAVVGTAPAASGEKINDVCIGF